MNNTELLLENLFRGDLKGILKTVISIDDFESKIDDDTLVLAFYCTDEDAAEDLAVFLERSSVDAILDTEVSSSTNKDRDYLVFVELNKSDDYRIMKDNIDKILKLCNIMIDIDEPNWRIKNMRYLGKKLAKYSDNNMKIILSKILEE
jgi:hypothetical protein